MIGRGTVDDAFRLDRSLGAVVEGRLSRGRFDYHAGVFGPPVGGLPTGGRAFPIYLVRVATSPLGPTPLTQTPILDGVERGRFVIGTHAWATKLERDIPGTDMGHDETWTATVGADVQVLVRKAYVLAEGFVRIDRYDRRYDDGSRVEGTDIFGGAQLQLGVFVWKDLVELQARAGTLTHPDFPPIATSFQGGVAVYPFGNHLRVQAYVAGCTDPVNGDPYACAPLRAGVATQIWF